MAVLCVQKIVICLIFCHAVNFTFEILGCWNTPETLIPATKPVISSTLYPKPCYDICIQTASSKLLVKVGL
jgi:hypothetical protein